MDERLEKALEFGNYMVTLNNQKRLLKQTYEQELLYFYKGSTFTVTKELITFVSTLKAQEQDTISLVDDNTGPVEVTDVEGFYQEILDTYFSATNKYLTEYNKIKTNRSVESMVEFVNE